jgi:small subunit ribosomal protein S8
MIHSFYFCVGSINHASYCRRSSVSFNSSKLVLKVLYILSHLGYIRSYNIKNGVICLNLKYFNDEPVIKLIKSISTPGRRVYWSCSKLKYMVNKTNSLFILSTNKGLLTSDKAIFYGIGGEVLLLIK